MADDARQDGLPDVETERALVQRAARGDADAFDALMKSHHAPVFRLAWRLMGTRDEAEMLTQDVFVQAFRSLKSFNGRSRLMTWLYAIATRKAIDRRRRKRVLARFVAMPETMEPARDGRHLAAPDPSEELGAKELQERVQEAMAKLSPDQRAALVLVTQEGMDYVDAAKVMKCSRGTIAWRVFNARRLLREMLSSYLGTEAG